MDKTVLLASLKNKKEMANILAKAYYEKNKEFILDKKKKDRLKNPVKYKELKKKEYEKNKDNYKQRKKDWYEKNKEYVKEKNKEYCLNNKTKVKESKISYRKENKDKINDKKRNYRDNNHLIKLTDNIRRSIRYGFISNNIVKKSKTQDILGCSFKDLKEHVESQFESWMNWSNYGNPKDGVLEPNKTWDIDHIIPISSANSEEDVIRLKHFSNLQPLCSFNNRLIKKHNVYG